ncbi:uncharacterized protein LOC106055711 [Biomphalaria glabrata]|uniref:Uncharacterized protein LOC106055711 n=2 Tax=Biomphalaria TaxID=6525 RepID=A0A9U8E0L0_BIOGL|nr:uncharacterized protein LOC106055711 [Biomphalaria glabrata]
MHCISKRQLTYLALTFPALVYLFLMFSVIGQVCFKTDVDHEQVNTDYIDVVKTFQKRADSRILSRSEFFHESIDSRRLLNAGNARALPSHASPFNDLKNSNGASASERGSPPMFNCSSISQMRIRNKIGHGVSKQAFLAEYQGLQVAIKMVTRHIHELKTCLEQLRQLKVAQEIISRYDGQTGQKDQFSHKYLENLEKAFSKGGASHHEVFFNDLTSSKGSKSVKEEKLPLPTVKISPTERQRCYTFPTARLMKEILLSQQLTHPNLVKLLGFCVRSEESESTDISEHGVVSVFELGKHFVLDNLQILPWPTRLRHAREMADLLSYLEHSPLGSLIVPDFKEGHLLMANGSLKLIDLDDVNNLEPECDPHKPQEGQCPYNLRCVRALCEGFNAKENLKNMNSLVLKRLLFPLSFPENVVPKIGQLNAQLDSLAINAEDLKVQLRTIQQLLGS